MPGVRALNHPTFLSGREAFRPLWACLHFEAPSRTMLDHPRVEVVIMILHVSKNGLKARKLVRGDVAEQVWGRHAIIEARTGNEDGKQQPPVSTKRCRLRPLIFLPPSYPRSGPPISVVLTVWLSMPMALGVGSRPACTRVCSRKALTNFSQVPSSRHWAK